MEERTTVILKMEKITPTIARCTVCGLPRAISVPSCPQCGAEKSIVKLDIREALKLASTTTFKRKVKRQGLPGHTQELTLRHKRAGASGNPAREELYVDRTAPDMTVKKHLVKELVGGEWQTVHQHEDRSSAKRRGENVAWKP